MSFRFVHTADVHLDSPLRTLALKDEELATAVANATRTAFVATVDLCIEEEVDALLIAGDLYDGDLRSIKTASFFASEMRRLATASIRVFIVKGNHDAESKVTPHLALPDNVHVFTSRGQSVLLEDLRVAVHGCSFAKVEAPDSLLPKYKPAVAGLINIGLLHTSLAGSSLHDTYAPCSVQDLVDQGYDYWALGHIHKREIHAESTSGDGPTIVMPGIPQGRHINEAGPRSVSLVEIDDEHAVRVQERFVNTVQFERVEIDLSGISDWQELPALLEIALSELMTDAQAECLIARVSVTGITSLASRLLRDRDLLLAEVVAAGRQVGQVLIEEIRLEVNPEPQASERGTLAADPVEELRKIVSASTSAESSVLTSSLELWRQLQQALPPEIRDALGATDEELLANLERAGREGAAEVLARLELTGSGG